MQLQQNVILTYADQKVIENEEEHKPVHFSAYLKVKNYREAPIESPEYNAQAAIAPVTPVLQEEKEPAVRKRKDK